MSRHTTSGIVLSRTNFGEADRIITLLSDGHGKLHLLAKGARREKSKLAGGIELFSINQITYIAGRGSVATLVSSRMATHWGNIVKQLPRTMTAYAMLKLVNAVTQDDCDASYFVILSKALATLNNETIDPLLAETWLMAQLLKQGGAVPELTHDDSGAPLQESADYLFDPDSGKLIQHVAGTLSANHIKLLRLLFINTPDSLARISGYAELLPPLHKGLQHMSATFLH